MDSYAGIGSRKTPKDILDVMANYAYVAGRHGWVLRTGGAPGADQAFERGAKLGDCKIEMYLPWPGFENHSYATLDEPADEAYEIAKRYHPAWGRLSHGAKKLIARNTHQVLGETLDDPATLVVCWTEGGKMKGGTAQALRIAEDYSIPIKNMGIPSDLEEIAEIASGTAP